MSHLTTAAAAQRPHDLVQHDEADGPATAQREAIHRTGLLGLPEPPAETRRLFDEDVAETWDGIILSRPWGDHPAPRGLGSEAPGRRRRCLCEGL
jgi:hypothetical protein